MTQVAMNAGELMPRGGANAVKIQVDIDEIEGIAEQLQGLGARYEEARARLLPLLAQVTALAALDVTGSGDRAGAALGLVALKVTGLAVAAGTLSASLTLAAENYRQAEEYASQLLSEFLDSAGLVVPATSLALSYFNLPPDQVEISYYRGEVKVGTAHPAKTLGQALDAWRQHPKGAAFYRKATEGLANVARIVGATGRLKAHTAVPQDNPDYLDPSKPPVGPPPPAGTPRTAAEMSRNLQRSHDYTHQVTDEHFNKTLKSEVEADGVMVQKFLDPDTGETRWVVTVPGTDGEITDFNGNFRGGPLSWASNTEMADKIDQADMRVEDMPASMQLALAAMQEAGVPEGANVMFAGYSQGGMVATALANNQYVRSRYSVKSVVTQNTPVHGVAIAQGTDHLDITHRQDPVNRFQPDTLAYSPTEQVWVGEEGEMNFDVHSAQPTASAAEAEPEAQQQSRVLNNFFDGNYQLHSTHVQAGTTRDPSLTQEGIVFYQGLGLANGGLALAQETEVTSLLPAKLQAINYFPAKTINPADLAYSVDYTAYEAEAWLYETVYGEPAPPKFAGVTYYEPSEAAVALGAEPKSLSESTAEFTEDYVEDYFLPDSK